MYPRKARFTGLVHMTIKFEGLHTKHKSLHISLSCDDSIRDTLVYDVRLH
jgi:hypothetical protein